MKIMRGVVVTAALLAPAVFGLANTSALTVEGDALPEAVGGRITLTENVNSCITVEDGDDLELVPNGYSLTAANTTCSAIEITGGKLLINDYLRVNAAGTETTTVPLIEQRGGVLTINAGDFKAANAESPVLVDSLATADTLSVTGGSFTGQIKFTGDKFISGGSFSANPEAVSYSSNGVSFDSQASAVKDGYTAATYGYEGSYYGVFVPLSSATLNKTEYTLTNNSSVVLDISFNDGFYKGDINRKKSGLAKDGKNIAGTSVSYGCSYDGCNLVLMAQDPIENGDYDLVLEDFAGNTTSVPIKIKSEDVIKYGTDNLLIKDQYVTVRVEFKTPVKGGRKIKIEKKEIPERQADNGDVKFVFAVSVLDKDGNAIDVDDNEVTINLNFGNEAIGGTFEYLQFAYLDKDGKIQEWFDPEEDEYLFNTDKEWAYYNVSFKTTHLSDFAVLASNQEFQSAKDKNEILLGVPNTGGEAGVISGAIVAGTVVLACLVSSIVTLGSYSKIQKIVSFPTRFLKKMKK